MTASSPHRPSSDGPGRSGRPSAPPRQAASNPLDHDGPIEAGTPVPGVEGGTLPPASGQRHRLHMPWGDPDDHKTPEERRQEREEKEHAEDRLLMYSAIVGLIVLVGFVVFIVIGNGA